MAGTPTRPDHRRGQAPSGNAENPVELVLIRVDPRRRVAQQSPDGVDTIPVNAVLVEGVATEPAASRCGFELHRRLHPVCL